MAQNATLKKIIAEAKRIKKAHPKKFEKWTDYVKEASAKIKPAKKAAKKKPVKGYTVVEQGENDRAKRKKFLVQREPNGTFRNFKAITGLDARNNGTFFRIAGEGTVFYTPHKITKSNYIQRVEFNGGEREYYVHHVPHDFSKHNYSTFLKVKKIFKRPPKGYIHTIN